jgi:hypothetical protein
MRPFANHRIVTARTGAMPWRIARLRNSYNSAIRLVAVRLQTHAPDVLRIVGTRRRCVACPGCCRRILRHFLWQWAPRNLATPFQIRPARYRNGIFIAFHGSWDRAPYPQQGYNVVFQPLDGARASAQCEIFADGFAGAIRSPERLNIAPADLPSALMARFTFPMMCAVASTASFT